MHGYLAAETRKKYRLSNAQAAQRLDQGPRFLRHLEGSGYKKIITVDETWVYLDNTGGRRHIYYQFKGERTEESWTKLWQQSYPKGVMFFGGVSYYGKTDLYFVEPKAKINSQYYVDNLLKPLFEKDIPRLFEERKWTPKFHQDNAPAHASRITQQWLAESGLDFIPKEDWMGNSPDLALMDFCVNGIFKWKLFDTAPTTVQGLKRVMKRVWSNLDQRVIQKAFESWPNRIKMMIDNHGYHVEHKISGGKNSGGKEN